MARHPHRLAGEHYRGRYCHFLTASTHCRRPAFRDPELGGVVTKQLFQCAERHGFAVMAYCLMPDHVHVLVMAERSDSDFVKFLNLWRQFSGFWERQRSGLYLWQEGYWDHTLRDDESVPAIAAYIVWNPVRAGFAETPEQYPFSGSARFTVAELANYAPQRPQRYPSSSDG